MDDFKKEVNSVEELDSLLEEEFVTNLKEGDVVEGEEIKDEEEPENEESENKETTENEENEQLKNDEDEESSKDNEEPEDSELTGDEEFNQSDSKKKFTKEEKTNHAFAQLRKQAKESKKAFEEVKPIIEDLDNIARLSGFNNHKELVEAMKQRQQEEEAKRQNIDPEVYKKMKSLEQRIEQTEKEKKVQEQKYKIDKFVNNLDNFTKEYSLTQKEKEDVINNIDADGWELETLINLKNPYNFFKGYAADIIAERKVQKNLKKQQEEKKFAENRYSNQSIPEQSIDEEIEKELKKYAKENGLSFD